MLSKKVKCHKLFTMKYFVLLLLSSIIFFSVRKDKEVKEKNAKKSIHNIQKSAPVGAL